MIIEQAILYLTEEGIWTNLDKEFGVKMSKRINSDRDLTSNQRKAVARKLPKYKKHLENWRSVRKHLTAWKQVKVTKDDIRLPRLDYNGRNFLLYASLNNIEVGRLLPKGKRKNFSNVWVFPHGSEFVRTLAYDYPDLHLNVTKSAYQRINLKLEQIEQKEKGLEKVKEIKLSDNVDYSLTLKTEPYLHQKKAILIGTTLDRAALLMEQGTGKTLSAIGIATHRYLKGQVKRLLVVAPKSVLPEWALQFEEHTDLPYKAEALDMKAKGKQKVFREWEDIENGINVITINYESLATFKEEVIEWKPDMIILDESQKIKNSKTTQAQAIYQIAERADVLYRLILTGTPVSESPLDFFGQYRFLEPSIFGYSWNSFRYRYAVYDFRGFKIKYYKDQEELASKAHSIAFRVTKEEANLSLPKENFKICKLPMEESERLLYNEMEEHSILELSNQTTVSAPLLITQLLKLQQITGGFINDEDGNILQVGDSKLNKIKDILQERIIQKKKTVIFCRFSPEVEAIHDYLVEQGVTHEKLTGSTKDRKSVLKNFKDDPDNLVFLAQIRAGGVGITLTSADTAIFYSTGYSLIDYEQAKARIHRIGQKQDVTYLHLVAKGTIDEVIFKALRSKKDIADLFVDQLKYIGIKGGSKMGKLDSKLKTLRKEMEEGTMEEVNLEELNQEVEEIEEEEVKAPKKGKKKAAKKEKAPKEDKGPVVTVAEIAEEIGVTPATLRRQLRTAGIEKPEGGRWEWPEGHEDIENVKNLKEAIEEERVAAAERKAAKAAAKKAKEESAADEETEAAPKKKKRKKKAAPVETEEDEDDEE